MHQASTTGPVDLRAILTPSSMPMAASARCAHSTVEILIRVNQSNNQSIDLSIHHAHREEGQELGFGGLLGALAGAGTVKAQVDAMDVLKEKLKKQEEAAANQPPPANVQPLPKKAS